MTPVNQTSKPEQQLAGSDIYWSQKFSNLLKLIGNAGQCRSCQAPVWWIVTKNKKPMPLNSDGEPHWARCPQAQQWRKR